ncbi:hypothetical protein BpHYR1_020413 [Brachionus plicatilis]|uniref:Uncharacterized protein n=1 Tax=Brachionus plicatilis TaxID=10195 RepID=A0A3M7QRZ3_BRAPC|nr:hypothetical protein BpHYR1_020413 [Brachionus plicatilis]
MVRLFVNKKISFCTFVALWIVNQAFQKKFPQIRNSNFVRHYNLILFRVLFRKLLYVPLKNIPDFGVFHGTRSALQVLIPFKNSVVRLN